VCDDGDACSVWREETFWVNYKPSMSWVNLTTYNNGEEHNFTDDANLNCTYNASDDSWVKWNDTHADSNGNLSFTFKWYVNRTGEFELYNTASTANVLTHGNTEEGDMWYCEATPNDGFTDGTPMNSSNYANIGADTGTGSSGDGIPYITNVTDNSDNNTPTAQGSDITFSISWIDSNSTSLNKVYICNSTEVQATGCVDYEFGRAGPVSDNPANVSFIIDGNWSFNQTAYVYIYDDEWINSSYYEENFSVNHRPTVGSFEIDYITSSSLTCKYEAQYSDSDNHDLNASLSEFKWWMDGVLQSYTIQNISSISIPNHKWVCGVKVYDNHSLSSLDYINSSDFHGTGELMAPLVWALPAETSDVAINITGFINYSHDSLNISAVATQNYSVYTKQSNATVNSTYVGLSNSDGDFAYNNTYIVVDDDDINYFAVNNLMEFENHYRIHYKRYNITGREYLWDGSWKINVSPNLEAAVSDNEKISLYNESGNSTKPTGWFNISDLSLFAGYNTLTIRGYQNVTVSGNVLMKGIATTITIYRDNQTPFINTSLISTSSNEASHTIKFNITDDYMINISTLLLNITNQSPITNYTHRYDNTIYDNDSWDWTWGENISCSGNSTLQECEVDLNLNDGNYSLWFSINDSVNHTNITIIQNYLIDTTKPVAPTIVAKAIQNTTNLSVLWKDSDLNLSNVQYAVGTAKNPNDGWDNVTEWTNATNNPLNKTIDANDDEYPNGSEVLIISVDFNLTSDDNISRAGNASLRRFTNSSFMFNCSNSTHYNPINCTIVRVVYNNSDNISYDNRTDELVLNGTNSEAVIINASLLSNFTDNLTYSDANHDNNYTYGEAIVFDNNTDFLLSGNGSAGTLNGIGNDSDAVIVNGTADMWVPLTTTNLDLVNHYFYYVAVRYKTHENLFYSNVGSSLVIKYKTTTSGLDEEQEDNYTGPGSVIVTAPAESSTRNLTASWDAATDDRYDIQYYEYAIGTAKNQSSGWNSVVSWTRVGLNLTTNYTSDSITSGEYYYWNVRAVNVIGNISEINSSDGTLYHDQTPPVLTLINVSNDNISSDGWLDEVDDDLTIIWVDGDENMTCFVSPYDKWYSDYNFNNDTYCETNSTLNMSCNVTTTSLDEGTNYTYYIVCQDNVSNGHNKTQNLDVNFRLDWPTAPEVRNLSIHIYDENMTYRGNASYLQNITYTDDILDCNGTFYDQDGDSLLSYEFRWKANDVLIDGETTYQLNLSLNGSKGDNITCEYNVTDDSKNTTNHSTTYVYNVTINNSKPTVGAPVLNSSVLENRSNESLICYAQSASDADDDTVSYIYYWYKNTVLNKTISHTNTSSNLINKTNTSKGDNWTCSVMPFDGEENGTFQNSTVLTIINTGPDFSGTIPNIVWNKNTNKEFNMSPYFPDIDNDDLIYNYTSDDIDNISMSISSGVVTFTPDSEFTGVRTIQFNATDGEYWTSYSNTVTLNVTSSTINITLHFPVNYYNASNDTVVFNCSANSTSNNNISNITLNVWNSTSALIFNGTNTTNLNSTLKEYNVTLSYTDAYTWNCEVCNNVSECESADNNYQVTLDTTLPNITFASGTAENFSNVSRNWTYVEVSLNETNAQNTSFILINTSSSSVLNQTNYTTAQTTHNWTNLSEGNYSYNVTLCDYAGNCNSTKERRIVLDMSGPYDVPDVGNETVNDINITVNWSASKDNYSGVKGYRIYRNNTYISNTSGNSYTDTGLNGSTAYLYNVTAYDYAGNEGLNNASIVINTSEDTTAPVIDNVTNSTPTTSSITINWTTSENANSSVNYGTTKNLGSYVRNATYNTSHSVDLSSLSADTTYYYNITSCDGSLLCGNSSEYNFTTEASGSDGATDTGRSSGGGGGGGAAATITTVVLGSDFTNYIVEKKDQLEVTLDEVGYTLKATAISIDYMTFELITTSQTFTLNIGDTLQIDFNNDAKNDIDLKLMSIDDGKATAAIRSVQRKGLERIIIEPSPEQRAPPVEQPIVEQYSPPKKKGDNTLAYAITAFMAIALVGGLVMKEKMRIDYINTIPELKVHHFVNKSKKKGYKINEIKKALKTKGWPRHIVDSIVLHNTITNLLKKGNNQTMVKEILKSKGINHKIVNNAMINHYINESINKRKSIGKIKKELIDSGWDSKIVESKLPKKAK